MNPRFLSESCLLWSFGDTLDEPTIRATLTAFRVLTNNPALLRLGVVDLVPAYNQLAIHFNGSEHHHREILATVTQELTDATDEPAAKGTCHILPVRYTGADLDRVAQRANMTAESVIRRHTAPEYLVAMIGFQPHFPYLFGLDPKLETPRLQTPRLQVPAGSVAIGGAQTGVYPTTSPGGWNLIGLTDPARLRVINPGDRVRFTEASI